MKAFNKSESDDSFRPALIDLIVTFVGREKLHPHAFETCADMLLTMSSLILSFSVCE